MLEHFGREYGLPTYRSKSKVQWLFVMPRRAGNQLSQPQVTGQEGGTSIRLRWSGLNLVLGSANESGMMSNRDTSSAQLMFLGRTIKDGREPGASISNGMCRRTAMVLAGKQRIRNFVQPSVLCGTGSYADVVVNCSR